MHAGLMRFDAHWLTARGEGPSSEKTLYPLNRDAVPAQQDMEDNRIAW